MPVQITRETARCAVASPSVEFAIVAPPRLNFAGFCFYCDERGCRSVGCVTRYNASWWVICPACGGRSCDEFGTACGCAGGVTEAFATTAGAVQAFEPLPSRPAVPAPRRAARHLAVAA